jgi:long-chain acyl-CoA synthetase
VERFWVEHYPAGVASEIDADLYPNISVMVDEAIARFGDAPAITSFGASLSYHQMGAKGDAFAAYLAGACGLKPGDRVAIMSPNLLQYPVALLGILRAGLIAVNVNPLYTPRELIHQLKDSGASAIVICDSVTASLGAALKEVSIAHVIVTDVGDLLPETHQAMVTGMARAAAEAAGSRADLADTTAFLAALAQGAALVVPRPVVASGDLAFLQYTGGTTGRSKGAMLTHRNIIANVLQGTPMMEAGVTPPMQEGDIAVTPLPLYHVYALGVFFGLLRSGMNNVLIPNPRDMTFFINTIAPLKMRLIMGINTLFAGMLAHPAFDTIDFSRLQFTLAGGAATQASVAEAWARRTGCPIQEGYGLSETSPTLSCTPALSRPPYTGAAGYPVPSVDFRLLDEDGREVAPGQPGEICVRGPNIMKGYWNQPEETAKVLDAEGWFKTGDIAVFDPDGRIRIVDRLKDMILVSGFNVYPNEIEDVLAAHPGVAEVAVIGRPSAHTGESVVAVVVKRDPALTEAELVAYARQSLTGYKSPKTVIFVADLPKTNVGKVLRRELRDRFAKAEAAASA